MQSSDDGFVPMNNFETFFKGTFAKTPNTNLPEFDFVSLDVPFDGANLVPINWTVIGNKLLSLWQYYDGFIVLHGTDTMAYTAAALSFMFRGNDKPIVVTGSQIPLSEKNSDAYENVLQSLKLATCPGLLDVCICFNGKVLRGNRGTKVSSAQFDAFISPNYPCLGSVNSQVKLQSGLQLSPSTQHFIVPEFNCGAVLVLRMFPGISEVALEGVLNQNSFRAVIIQTFGKGNSPNHDSPLIQIIERAVAQELVVLNITQCIFGGVTQHAYSTGNHLNKLGVIAGHDMTMEAAFAKLHFLIGVGLNAVEIKQQLNIAIAGEWTA